MNAATVEAPETVQSDYPLVRNAVSSRLAYADVLRTLAAFAVVVIHVSGQGVVHPELETNFSWWVANCFDGGAHWSVPCFVMVSGALLLGSTSRESLWDFYRKRASRVGIPLVVWSVFYLLWREYYGHEHLSADTIRRSLLTGTPQFHLYFLFLICGLYLFTPMMRTFVRNASDIEVWTAVILLLTLSSLTYVARVRMFWSTPLATDMYFPYVGYFLAGYAITQRPVADHLRRFWLAASYIAALVCYLIIIFAVGKAHAKSYQRMNMAIALYYEYLSPATVILTLSIFTIFFDFYKRPGVVRDVIARICAWIAPATFGIYLIHVILLGESFRWGMPVYPNTLISIPAWSLGIVLTALAITKVIQYPGFRRIVG